MKKILTTLIVLLICVQAQAKYIGATVRTLPYIQTVIMSPLQSAFWEAAALTQTMIWVLEWHTEPLENYDAGVWNYNLSEVTKIVYPEWNYPQRDLTKDTTYHFTPTTREGNWSIRTSFTVTLQDGTATTTLSYSIIPPSIPDFERCKIKLSRAAVPGLHQSNFNYDSTGTTIFYLMRNGAAANVRPVRVQTFGFLWTATLDSNDYVRKILGDQFNPSQWIFQTPMSYSVWIPDAQPAGLQCEWSTAVITTAL